MRVALSEGGVYVVFHWGVTYCFVSVWVVCEMMRVSPYRRTLKLFMCGTLLYANVRCL